MLIANDICKKYKHPVLAGVSCKISEGEIIGIAGENGSGKSTLLSILVTLLSPDKGTVTLDGIPLTPASLKTNIGYVPQENALFDHLTVQDNLRFWAAAYGAILDETVLLTKMFPRIQEARKKKVAHLSGGMKKQLSIAIACMNNPRFLIMDEPSAALDIGFKRTLLEIFEGVKAEGRSCIFTSHQPDELLWCDRIYVLRNGVFAYEGTPRELEPDFSERLYDLCGMT